MKNAVIAQIQQILHDSGFPPGPVDGIYGDKTEAAILAAVAAGRAAGCGYDKPAREIKGVFIHCSASDAPEHDNIGVMRAWHLERGFNEVGYHYFIRKDGTLESGRATSLTPAAQRGYNANTIAVCVHGLKKDEFTEAQFKTLRKLCTDIREAHGHGITFHGHCEVSAKSCPVFDYRNVLQLTAEGRLGL